MSEPKNSKDALEFIHTLDSLAIKKQKEEIARLKAEVERLRKAGDAMADEMLQEYGRKECLKINSFNAWNAAKEGKQS